MTTILPAGGLDAVPPLQAVLRTRIGWLCHLIRIAAVLWAGWLLANNLWGWRQLGPDTAPKIAEGLGHLLNADLSGLSNAQVVSVYAEGIGLWAFNAAIAFCIWRLFGTYLQGRIFTIDAAIWLRRLGMTGFAAVLAEIVGRRLSLLILTSHAHVPAITLLWSGPPPLIPFDALRAVFCLLVVMLGQIFKTAAAMADDHAQIV